MKAADLVSQLPALPLTGPANPSLCLPICPMGPAYLFTYVWVLAFFLLAYM